MHHNHGQCIRAIVLPVTVAEDPDAGFNLNQPLLSRRDKQSALQEESSQGLLMTAAQPATRAEFILNLR